MGILHQVKKILRPFIPGRRGDEGFPDWRAILAADRPAWEDALRRAGRPGSPRVLIATGVGGFAPGAVMESLLAVAATLRGARAEFLLCDAALPACLQTHVERLPDAGVLQDYRLASELCDRCRPVAEGLFAKTGLPVRWYSDTITEADRREARDLAAATPFEDIARLVHQGLPVGEHAHAGALRYYARGRLDGGAESQMVLRRFLEASLLTAASARRLLATERFDAVVLNHGIYVPQGLVAEAARAAGTRLVTWNVAYRKSCFIFSHGGTYHHTLMDEPVSAWEDLPWSEAREREVLDYLASRLSGARDWIWFHERPKEDVDRIAAECGVDFAKPVVGLLTNVFWDAQLHYRANAFPDMLDWMVRTIRWFAAERPDLQLLIRVHPAEVRGTIPSRQPVLAELKAAFPDWPANVFVIPPESDSSTYAAMYKCDAVLIYGTKTGVELSAVGIPVIVGGEAWIRGKGVTRDAASAEEYFRILSELPTGRRLDEATTRRARKYAYHFFFRRMIPVPMLKPADVPAHYVLEAKGPSDLLPGASPGLDVICDGVLTGSPFVYPAERLGVSGG